MSVATALERDIVIAACAISAGIHAGLVRDHFAEGAGAGSGFLASAVLLLGLATVLTTRPPTLGALAMTAALLVGLLASYAFAVTTGVPVLHPEPEPIDALALATKAIEGLGLVTALHLIGRDRAAVARNDFQPKGAHA
jgi:hypothetical protein